MALSSFLRAYAATVGVSDRPSVSLKFSNIFLSENNNSRYGPSSPFSARGPYGRAFQNCPPTAVVHASPRFVGAADARIEYGVSAPDGRGGKLSSLHGPEKSQKAEIVAPYSAANSPPYPIPDTAAAFDEVARVLLDRLSFGIRSNSWRRPMGEEENYPPCKALKSLKTRKSLPRHPRRDSPPSRDPPALHRLDELGRRLQPDRAEMVSSMSRLSYRHLSLFQPESEHAHIRRMSLQAVAL
jgi:hypothetical protein